MPNRRNNLFVPNRRFVGAEPFRKGGDRAKLRETNHGAAPSYTRKDHNLQANQMHGRNPHGRKQQSLVELCNKTGPTSRRKRSEGTRGDRKSWQRSGQQKVGTTGDQWHSKSLGGVEQTVHGAAGCRNGQAVGHPPIIKAMGSGGDKQPGETWGRTAGGSEPVTKKPHQPLNKKGGAVE